jgi:hypothetical protein
MASDEEIRRGKTYFVDDQEAGVFRVKRRAFAHQ